MNREQFYKKNSQQNNELLLKGHTILNEIDEIFDIKKKIPTKHIEEIKQNENIDINPNILVKYKLQKTKNKKSSKLSKNSQKRNSPEQIIISDSESMISTSEKHSNKRSKNDSRSKRKKGIAHTFCPYCKQQMVLINSNFERHIQSCFKKQEELEKRKQSASQSSVKRSLRSKAQVDRFSPENYSDRVYKYFKNH